MWAPGTADSNPTCPTFTRGFGVAHGGATPCPSQLVPWQGGASLDRLSIPHLITREEPVTSSGKGSIR